MQVTISWEAIAALTAILAAASTFSLWIVRNVVRDEVKKINGTYVRSAGSKVTGHEIEHRLDTIDAILSHKRA